MIYTTQRRRFLYDTWDNGSRLDRVMVECTLCITHCLRLNLQLHTIDLVRTCRISSFWTVARHLARFQLTRRIARPLGDSWGSCLTSMVVNVHARLRPLLTTVLTVIKKQEKFPVHSARLLLMMTRRYNVEHVIVIFTTFVPTYKILFWSTSPNFAVSQIDLPRVHWHDICQTRDY